MNDHFSKPIDLDKMRSVIASLLEGRRADSLPMSPPEFTHMDTLHSEYRQYLGKIATKFEIIMALRPESELLRAVANFAHAIAGSAGSFGFHDVSDAAFTLESTARKQIEEACLDTHTLQEKIADLVFTSAQAI